MDQFDPRTLIEKLGNDVRNLGEGVTLTTAEAENLLRYMGAMYRKAREGGMTQKGYDSLCDDLTARARSDAELRAEA